MTRLWSVSGSLMSFSLSPSTSFATGTPLQRETTSAISSAVTSSRRRVWESSLFLSSSWALSSRSSCGMTPYLILEASLRSPACSACSYLVLAASRRVRTFRTSSSAAFSFFHCAVIASDFALSSRSSSCSSSSRFLEASSFSFLSATSSISRRRTWREISSSSCGQESISVRILAHASSSRSIALSGRNLSWM